MRHKRYDPFARLCNSRSTDEMKICIRNGVKSKDDFPSFSQVCRSGLVNVSRTRLRNKLANGNRTRLVKYEFKKNEIKWLVD